MPVPPAVPVNERQTNMKKLIGIATFVLLFSIPAHAQSRGGGIGSAASANAAGGGGAGGGTGGGGIGGNGGARLQSYPRASFEANTVSGGDPSFAPSTFLSFDQAVAEGKAIIAADQKSLAQTAAENSATPKAKAKVTFVQDAEGKVVPTAQQ
jgi:hypothetical protein